MAAGQERLGSVAPGPAAVRRRPSGEPPPLPRHVSGSTVALAALALSLVPLWVALSTTAGTRLVTALDQVVLELLDAARTDPSTRLADTLLVLGSIWAFRVVAWATLVVLALTRRFQELFVCLAVLLTVPVVAAWVSVVLGRMRPAGIEMLGTWEGYAHPSRPVANLALGLTVAVVALVPAGRWRARAARTAAVVVALLVVARLYAAVDHPSDVWAALLLGSAAPLVALRLLRPEEVYPVTYRRGIRAHLDVSGVRGEAIRTALARQLGVTVAEVEPFGAPGSAGSTPLRIVTADPPGQVFAKLYASTHLWSDRWYKLGRTVRYGRLEDERPFNTVRRLVQYEDHMQRLLRDSGVPTPAPLGIVEITPEREYIVVTEHLDGAVQLSDAHVDEHVAGAALAAVRRLWDAGLAHRDIKPANVLVRGQEVWLVDVAFAEVRPTPWRQAVDLANMLLALSLRCDPEVVYRCALDHFTPDEIAEALAATRSVTVPSELRARLRADGRDLYGRLRALAPERAPVAIQRWTLRRVALTLAVLVGALAAFGLVAANLELAGLL